MAPVSRSIHDWTLAGKALLAYAITLGLIVLFVAYEGYQFKDDQIHRNRAFTILVCKSENERWVRLKQNLISVALHRRAGETDQEFKARSDSTIRLLDGLTDVRCTDQP